MPWVNEEDALKKALSTQDYASKQADLWRNGLETWGQRGVSPILKSNYYT
jgi:hypothetical protein